MYRLRSISAFKYCNAPLYEREQLDYIETKFVYIVECSITSICNYPYLRARARACVCVRERERERERGLGQEFFVLMCFVQISQVHNYRIVAELNVLR